MSHIFDLKEAGVSIGEAKKALIMLHGRGATAESILTMNDYLNIKGFALLAPQATNNTWYPYSFMAPEQNNEPWLSSAIDIVDQTVEKVLSSGIESKDIYFLGFSQGACLTIEYTSRFAKRYGGVVVFTGGLIGKDIYAAKYSGDFNQTPIFFGTSNPDFHVPVERVQYSADISRKLNADVTLKVYENRGHNISEDEINLVNSLIFK